MDNHNVEDPPIDDPRQQWLQEDAHIFLQIGNSINSEIISLFNQCEFFN